MFYYDPVPPPSDQTRTGEEVRILLGNSASKGNRHPEAFEMLSRFRQENIKVICPLSYNSPSLPDYHNRVFESGERLLGDKFVPLTELMPQQEYAKVLQTMDILVYNHPRQQGLFSLSVMLHSGKKCFLRSETSSYAMLRDFGVHVFPTESIPSLSFAEFCHFPPELAEANRQKWQQYLSLEASVAGWRELFDDFRDRLRGKATAGEGAART